MSSIFKITLIAMLCNLTVYADTIGQMIVKGDSTQAIVMIAMMFITAIIVAFITIFVNFLLKKNNPNAKEIGLGKGFIIFIVIVIICAAIFD